MPDRRLDAAWLPRLNRWLLVAAALTALCVAVVVTDVVPALRGPAPYPPEWRWVYLPLGWERPERILLPALALVLYLVGGGLWAHRRLAPRVAVALAVGFLFLWQLAPAWMREASLLDAMIERVYSPPLNGYFVAPAQVDSVAATLHNYYDAMPTFFADHPKTHPPGLFIFYAVFNDLAARLEPLAAWFAPIARGWAIAGRDWPLLTDDLILSAFVTAWVQVALTSLAPLTLYAALRQLPSPVAARADLAAWGALALPLLAPLSHFLLQWDTAFPTLGFAAWAWALRGQARHSGRDGLAAGLLFSLLTWLSFGLVVFIAIVGLHLLWQEAVRWRAERTLRVAGLLAMGAGLALPWLLAYAVWGMNPWALLQRAMHFHYELVTALRDEAFWRWMNLVDFAFWLGPGILLLGGLGSVWLWRRAPAGPLARLAVIYWTALLILNLSGSTRGEIGRIWLFLMPFPMLFGLALPWRAHHRLLILLLLAVANLALAYAIAPLVCC